MKKKKAGMSMKTMSHVRQNILNVYDDMTAVEQSIADFFIKNEEVLDFSSKNISKLLYISEATLSRFAKKCQYKGYRKFIYEYEKELAEELHERNISVLTRRVKNTYGKLMEESFHILDEEKVKNVSNMMSTHTRVLVCGMGSSGYVAREFQLRFMRLGMDIQAVTDSQMIQMTMALANENCLVIAISLSGNTKEILDAVRVAKSKKASVVMITANHNIEIQECCDVILYIAATKNLDGGTMISPQFPVLLLIDVFYTYYLENDAQTKILKYHETLSALRGETFLKSDK